MERPEMAGAKGIHPKAALPGQHRLLRINTTSVPTTMPHHIPTSPQGTSLFLGFKQKISTLPLHRAFSPSTNRLHQLAKLKHTGQTTPLAPQRSQPLVLLRNQQSPEQGNQQTLFTQGILYCQFSHTSERWRTPGYRPDCRPPPATQQSHISLPLALESSQGKGLHLHFCFLFASGLLIRNQRATPTGSGGSMPGDHSILPQEEQLQSTSSYPYLPQPGQVTTRATAPTTRAHARLPGSAGSATAPHLRALPPAAKPSVIPRSPFMGFIPPQLAPPLGAPQVQGIP